MVASSSLNLPRWTYDVFPSFRGKDVRRSFLSHLFQGFDRKGIITFEDNRMERGKSISSKLVQAINESRIYIIILSKNYASSSWCLNELVEIIKCHQDNGKMVLTVFYDVDPCDVRKQEGEFGEAYKKACKEKTKEEKEIWDQALIYISNIPGEHSRNWETEAAMISKIARDISKELNLSESRDFDDLVGIEAHISNMNSLLSQGPDVTRMIGIWGPAGIGKTTIARVLYNRISSNFKRCLFMENVKGSYRRNDSDSYYPKSKLQTKFLSKILNHKDMKMGHLGRAKERLKYQKVLVVLDDVDKIEQLDALAKEPNWFGKGSLIIVTTSDKQLLEAHKITLIYEVGFPSRDEALQIFSQSAFSQNVPPKGYEALAVEVVELTSHLPLGLCVLGSALRGKSVSEWKNELPRLKTSLNVDIEQALRVDYDRLDDTDKALFLDIASPSGSKRQYLANSLNVLVKRALISILNDRSITMHRLLQQMGRAIAHRFPIHLCWICRLLMGAHEVLADNTGTETVGILVDTSVSVMHDPKILSIYRNLMNMLRQRLLESLVHLDPYTIKGMPFGFRFQIDTEQSNSEKLLGRFELLVFNLLSLYAYYMAWLLKHGFRLMMSMFPPAFGASQG